MRVSRASATGGIVNRASPLAWYAPRPVPEQRQHPRVIGPLRAFWHQKTSGHAAPIVNLSIGGCLMETAPNSPRPEEGPFRLHVGLPVAGPLWLSGVTARAQSDRAFGVRFTDHTDQHRRALAQTVEYLMRADLLHDDD